VATQEQGNAGSVTLLAAARHRAVFNVARVVLQDGRRHGAVSMRVQPGLVRRAEPGPAGPLVLEARSEPGGVVCEVWGSARTPREAAESSLEDALAWAGLRDDPLELEAVVAGHTRARQLARRVGEVRLSRIPRVGEALGRAIVCQHVVGVESQLSILQLAARVGTRAAHGLWTWPTAAQMRAAPAWLLRRCGIPLRKATALHAAAASDVRLREAVGRWDLLEQRLAPLPGVGVWTRAETRMMLGDPDSVSLGDYHLPSWIGAALGDPGRSAWRGHWTDDDLLELLEPFAGQRCRILRMCELAVRDGLVPKPPRRAPRAALSAHRYW
jgi:3-methyladenine DNA glycosylase/8-oxoguanine DNA glycosylase